MKTQVIEVLEKAFQFAINNAENAVEKGKLKDHAYELNLKLDLFEEMSEIFKPNETI